MEIFKLLATIAINRDEAIGDLAAVNTAGEQTGSSLGRSLGAIGGTMTSVGGKMTAFITGPLTGLAAGAVAAAKELGNQADRLFDLEQQTGLSITTLQEFTNVTRVAGVDMEALTGPAQALFRSMHQLDDESKRAGAALTQIGVSTRTADGELRSMDELLPEIIHALQGMEDITERNTLATTIFRGSANALAPVLGMTAAEFEAARAQAHDLGDVLGRDALEQADNFRVNMELLTGELGNAGREIVVALVPVVTQLVEFIRESVVPVIRGFAEGIAGLVEWFNGLPGPVQSVIGVVTGLLAAAGPVIAVVGSIITKVVTLLPLLPKLGLAFAVITSPVGLVVAAIVALIAIGVAIVKNWDEIKAAAGAAWTWIKDAVAGAVTAIRDGIANALTAMRDLTLGILEAVRGLPARMLEIGKDIVRGLIDGIRGMIDSVRETVTGLGESIGGWFKGILGIESPSQVFRGYGRSIGQGLAQGIQDSTPLVESAVNRLARSVTEPFEEVAARLGRSFGDPGTRPGQFTDEQLEKQIEHQQRLARGIGIQGFLTEGHRRSIMSWARMELEMLLAERMRRQATPDTGTPGLERGAQMFEGTTRRFSAELHITGMQLQRAVDQFSRDINQLGFANLRG